MANRQACLCCTGELSPRLAWALCIGLAVAGLAITATNFGRPITLLYAFGLFLGTIYRCCPCLIVQRLQEWLQGCSPKSSCAGMQRAAAAAEELRSERIPDHRHRARLPAQLWRLQRHACRAGPALPMEPIHSVRKVPLHVRPPACFVDPTFLTHLGPAVQVHHLLCDSFCDSHCHH